MKHKSIFHKSLYIIDNQLSPQFCSHLINKFEEDKEGQNPGVTAGGHTPKIKQSTDLEITFGPTKNEWLAEDKTLSEALSNGVIKYDAYLAKHLTGIQVNPDMFDTGHQMQRTSPGGFYDWHCDACDTRQLTYIFYLNDVKGGDGYTEFCDGTRIYPKAGRMLIFPADWLHVHRGVAPKKDLKYIITGWLYTKYTGDRHVMKMSGLPTPEELQQHNHDHLEHQQTTEIH